MFPLLVRSCGRDVQVIIIRGTCEWCGLGSTNCAMMPTSKHPVLLPSGHLFYEMAVLCPKCFQEWWLAWGQVGE